MKYLSLLLIATTIFGLVCAESARADIQYLGFLKDEAGISALMDVDGDQDVYSIEQKISAIGVVSSITPNSVIITQSTGSQIRISRNGTVTELGDVEPASFMSNLNFDELFQRTLSDQSILELSHDVRTKNYLENYGFQDGDKIIKSFDRAGARIVTLSRGSNEMSITIAPS